MTRGTVARRAPESGMKASRRYDQAQHPGLTPSKEFHVNPRLIALAAASLALAVPLTTQAATIKVDDDTNIQLNMRVQTQFFSTESNVDPTDARYDRENSFLLRRARLRFRANHAKWLTVYVQSDYEEQKGTSSDMRIIDAYVLLKPHELAWFYIGQNMAPAMRLNVTSSSSFLAIDRASMTYRALTWGARAKYAFTNTGFGDSNAKLNGEGRAPVRDLGVTLFGAKSLSDSVHVKYYLGAYDGVQSAQENNLRFTGRAQLNLLGKEGGYYNDGTYLGEKRTIGLGASYDTQKAVAVDRADPTKKVDYQLWSVDLFTEMPLPVGALTAEAGYANLDLGGGGALATLSGTAAGTTLGNAAQAQGGGFYGQLGYLVHKVQPWVGYEQWTSDAANKLGSFKAYRGGLNYYLKGTDVKLVAGYEYFMPDVPLAGGAQKTVQSFIGGVYIDL